MGVGLRMSWHLSWWAPVTDPIRAGELETDLIGLPADAAHVVMLTGNNFVVDPRALKTAMVLANWDLRVTAIGLPARGIRGEPTGSLRTPRCGTGSPGRPKRRRSARCTTNSWESCLLERGIPAQRRSID